MKTVKLSAYAKINLYLDVVRQREDGFHDIETVMHTLDLCDEVTVSVNPSRNRSVRLIIEGNRFLPTDSKNLAVKAANLFMDTLGIVADVNIRLVKRIPVAAGLAGGSSDAAAVLRALNRIYKKPFTRSMLAKISESLGSDVPYCVVGGTALCKGKGDKMSYVTIGAPLYAVIVSSGERVSTPEAYGELDKLYSNFDGSVDKNAAKYADFEVALKRGELTSDVIYNIFEEAILPKCPIASNAKIKLYALGSYAAMMSGSGSSVFGLFKTAEKAMAAAESLNASGFKAFFAKSV
jgi:4-diphosphocytidyl-2-C-methyl-D-erythritol kinase